jgi:hypothetical protein
MSNLSLGSWSTNVETMDFECEELTNNGLYLIFVGYLLPLLSPKVRGYGKELLSKFRNAGRVAGDIVSLTEFGFENIQDISDNKEMIKFIQRFCDSKKINILPSQVSELSWDFSGDTGNGEKDGKQETWKRLLFKLNNLSYLNKMDNTNRP